ncbi:hypothetical protein LFT45_21720 [Arthrobacter sp. FW305-BF8]|uniref:hypothetical protein n=1 Tax=Arthrobacter sp. FW305-BF8 TaxID=2879617 RepID=UPI001F2C9A37|nr:hypothetical protein [Arthrobacter sp. FW305-BF8]UKA54274.1 hypothetical protein LFT45_21720 [Arthrobacter sp. FW305-BF8]
MVRFRGLHIVAGIVAMGVAAALGTIMGLNNTAVFTSSCVVYVAVSLFVQSRLAKFRTPLQGLPQHLPDGVPLERTAERTSECPAEQLPSGEGNAA